MTSVASEPRRAGLDLRAAVWAGIISGAVFLALELIMVPVFLGMSAWAPPRMIAAIVMGESVLPSPDTPATFDIGIVLVAIVVHFVLSIIYATVLSFIIRGRPLGTAVLVGGIFGLALYVINFYGFTAIFPWFAMARNWVSIFAHIVFGIVAAWAFVRLARGASRPVAV